MRDLTVFILKLVKDSVSNETLQLSRKKETPGRTGGPPVTGDTANPTRGTYVF